MNNLGVAGFQEEARAMKEKALQGQESLLGQNHAHTLWTKKESPASTSTQVRDAERECASIVIVVKKKLLHMLRYQ